LPEIYFLELARNLLFGVLGKTVNRDVSHQSQIVYYTSLRTQERGLESLLTAGKATGTWKPNSVASNWQSLTKPDNRRKIIKGPRSIFYRLGKKDELGAERQ
jgi:hypothetical protein